MTDDIWAWFKTIVLRIEMGDAIRAWFKAIWRIEMGSCNLSLIQRQLFEDWNERWSLSLIQDNCFEDRNGRCNPNLTEDNCLRIQMRNATKLDSRQLLGDSNENCNKTWLKTIVFGDSNEKCNQTWFKTIIDVRIQMRDAIWT
jgi:hypothetical protein